MHISWKYLLMLMALFTTLIWIAVFTFPDKNLHLIACDVGQGDAILAVHRNTQILIDGGPGGEVLNSLARYMPFWDRKIEGILLTHPQKDHFGGLIEGIKRYEVGTFIPTALDSGSQDYKVLKDSVGGRGIRVLNPKEGMEVKRISTD